MGKIEINERKYKVMEGGRKNDVKFYICGWEVICVVFEIYVFFI